MQLVLVATSKDVHDVWTFLKFMSIINLVSASLNRCYELRFDPKIKLEELFASKELETCIGVNQIHTLQKLGAIRWSSHFDSINKLIYIFGATCTVLKNIIQNENNNSMNERLRGYSK